MPALIKIKRDYLISNGPAVEKKPGVYTEGATPVPIPNTAVKPFKANGIAVMCRERVGRRRVFFD